MAPPPSPSPLPPTIPATMRAWTFTTRGTPRDVLRLIDLPVPTPRPDQVLIKVSHVGFNGGMVVLFNLYPHFTSAPCVPEMDFSGVIVAAPGPSGIDDGPRFKVGDQVMGAREPIDLLKANGVLCEYIVAPRSLVTGKPKGVTMAEAAGLPACGVTAVQACRLGRVKAGDKVLITGGSGGLGSILVQYTRSVVGERGKIVATCSGRNIELVKKLGADEVVDYTVHKDLSAYCAEEYGKEEFDVIFDIIGDYQLHRKCPAYLKKDGVFMLLGDMKEIGKASYGTLIWFMTFWKLQRYRPVWLGGVAREHRMYNAMLNEEDLKTIAKVVDEKGIRMQVDTVWRMEDAKEAYEKMSSQRARGKIVIKVDPEAAD